MKQRLINYLMETYECTSVALSNVIEEGEILAAEYRVHDKRWTGDRVPEFIYRCGGAVFCMAAGTKLHVRIYETDTIVRAETQAF